MKPYFSPESTVSSRLSCQVIVLTKISTTLDPFLDRPPNFIPTLLKTVAGLQSENKSLQSQLRSLRHHLSVHQSRVWCTYDTKRDIGRKLETSRNEIRPVEERRNHLIAIHLDSVRGARAKEYKAVHIEYTRLQDQFSRVVVDHMLIRYQLQKLIIDTALARGRAVSRMVRDLADLVEPLLIRSLRFLLWQTPPLQYVPPTLNRPPF